MTTDTDKMIERVRALLAKAEGTDNPHEAEAFFAKATDLMDKYRLDAAHVREQPEQIVREKIVMTSLKFLRASAALLGMICKHYGVVVMGSATGNTKILTLVGEPSDIEAARMMFGSLIIQRDRACLAEPIPYGISTVRFRNSFAYGYAGRIGRRLTDLRTAQKSTADSMALEVYDRYKKVQDALGNPGSVNHNPAKITAAGVATGDRAATTADLGQDQITDTGPRALTSGR